MEAYSQDQIDFLNEVQDFLKEVSPEDLGYFYNPTNGSYEQETR